MRALDLDFIARPAIGNLAGIVLLLLGLAALAVSAMDALEWAELQQDLESRKAAESRRLQGGERRGNAAAPPRPEDARALREAQLIASRLKLPWQRLFDDTAGAAGEGVSLTGLQPDAATRSLRITGLARDLQAANGFVERLQAKPGFAHAWLVQHDLQRKDPEAALGFIVMANWREDTR